MSDIAQAEQLWTRAHEHVKRGEFAEAVRDLAQAFQILQAANDPRLYEVHRRWTEVHQMYVEDGARQQQAQAQAQQTPSIEAQAEAAANAGELEKAITLYQELVRARPDHELARERLQELLQARTRAQDLVSGRSIEPTPAAAAPEDDWSDINVDDSGPRAASPAPAAPVEASPLETASLESAPLEMAGLEVVEGDALEVVSDVAVVGSAIDDVAVVATTEASAASAEISFADVGSAATSWGSAADSAADSALSGVTVGASLAASALPVDEAPAAEAARPPADEGFDVKMSDELSFADLNEPAPAARTPAAAPASAPAMSPDDAPIGMQSLDVPFSVGSVITAEHATDIPVGGAPSEPPQEAVVDAAPVRTAPVTGPAAQIALLEELLARVEKNRRRVA